MFEFILNHRQLWAYITRMSIIEKRFVHKKEYFNMSNIECINNCFLCDYCDVECKNCPTLLYTDTEDCLGGLYYRWLSSLNIYTHVRASALIAMIPLVDDTYVYEKQLTYNWVKKIVLEWKHLIGISPRGDIKKVYNYRVFWFEKALSLAELGEDYKERVTDKYAITPLSELCSLYLDLQEIFENTLCYKIKIRLALMLAFFPFSIDDYKFDIEYLTAETLFTILQAFK